MAGLLQDHVITAQMNAWHYWATIGPAVLDDPLRQNPALIQYLISSGWDTEQLILTSLGFTLIFAIFSFFTSPERFAFK